MKNKIILILVISFISSLFSTNLWSDNSKSVYTCRPDDQQAVYFTSSKFDIDNKGLKDVSDELQNAINQVKTKYNFGIVFIPEGRYKISKTIYIPKSIRLIGYGRQRPLIFLEKNSVDVKYMFWFTSKVVKPNETPVDANAGTFYSAMSNINLKIEKGNPKAIALRAHFAQHCFISDAEIFIGDGLAGMNDVGNEISNVSFFGGDYGIMTKRTSPSWQTTLLNTTFKNQRKAAIKTEEAGLTIKGMTITTVPVGIAINKNRSDKIYIEDALFSNIKEAGILMSNEGFIPNLLNLRDISCENMDTILKFRKSGKKVVGKKGKYNIKTLSYGLHIKNIGAKEKYDLRVNLEEYQWKNKSVLPCIPNMEKWVNIQDLGAKGDNLTDDTKVFQDAIAKYDFIYVPQGWYVISESLKLNEHTCLIGLNPISTQLIVKNNTVNFSGFGTPVPLIESSVGGDNILSGIGLNNGSHNDRSVGCKWMAGENSYINDVKFLGMHGTMATSYYDVSDDIYNDDFSKRWDKQYWSLWVTNNGGGILNNLWSANTFSASGMYVNNTSTPTNVYQVSIEHHVRNEIRLNNVSNWNFYALQLEEETRESPDCQPIEIENSHDVSFANLYTFRVIWIMKPYPYVIRTWNCKDIEFYNIHNFTQMRFTTDDVLYDINTGIKVHPWEISRLTVTGDEKSFSINDEDSTASLENSSVERVATGFEYVQGLTKDSHGNIYFCEQRLKRIYKYDIITKKVSLLADFQWEPLSLAVDTKDHLLVIFKYINQNNIHSVRQLEDSKGTTYSHWGNDKFEISVYSLDINNPEESIKELDKKELRGYDVEFSKIVYPTHRWRDLNDFNKVMSWVPDSCFVAPDGVTIIPEYYDLARSSSNQEVCAGEKVYTTDEYNKLTVYSKVDSSAGLVQTKLFIKKGEFGLSEDSKGNIYIADGVIYVYNSLGKEISTLSVPERPTSILVSDGILYITARNSFYKYKIK